MLIIQQSSNDPYFNIASEEHLLKNFDEDIFVIYRNTPSVIVGKHQNTMAEINHEFVAKRNIPVIRRLSGGGTVYHDLGNINYTFITNGSEGNLVDFKKHTQPIIELLHQYGIDARIGGKNDIRVGDKKISGNAEHIYKNRVLHHGTLLFNSDLDELNESIRVNLSSYTDKAVKSIRSHVANITEFLNHKIDIEAFIGALIIHITKLFPNSSFYQFNSQDRFIINELISSKYSSWEWNYGYSPAYTLNRVIVSSNYSFEVMLKVDKGIISNIEIKPVTPKLLVQLLHGCIHEKNEIVKRLRDFKIEEYFSGIPKDEFIKNLF